MDKNRRDEVLAVSIDPTDKYQLAKYIINKCEASKGISEVMRHAGHILEEFYIIHQVKAKDRYSLNNIKTIIEILFDEAQAEATKYFVNGLPNFKAKDIDPFKELFRLYIDENEDYHYFEHIMKHWFQNLLFCLRGERKKTVYHKFLNFLGDQEAGKTIFSKNLLAPLEKQGLAIRNAGTKFITDDRFRLGVMRKHLVHVEELAGLDKANVEDFKELITSEVFGYRPMGTLERLEAENRTTFLGCSNKSIHDIIYDETGNRRLEEFRMKKLPSVNAPEYNKVLAERDEFWEKYGTLALLAEIDLSESGSYYKVVHEKSKERAAKVKTQTLVEIFLSEHNITNGTNEVKAEFLFKLFNIFDPNTKWSLVRFYRELNRIGIESFRDPNKGGRIVKINKKLDKITGGF